MARYVIDAPTLLHVIDNDWPIDAAHQLVAPSSIRSEALQLLLQDVRQGARTERTGMASAMRSTPPSPGYKPTHS